MRLGLWGKWLLRWLPGLRHWRGVDGVMRLWSRIGTGSGGCWVYGEGGMACATVRRSGAWRGAIVAGGRGAGHSGGVVS